MLSRPGSDDLSPVTVSDTVAMLPESARVSPDLVWLLRDTSSIWPEDSPIAALDVSALDVMHVAGDDVCSMLVSWTTTLAGACLQSHAVSAYFWVPSSAGLTCYVLWHMLAARAEIGLLGDHQDVCHWSGTHVPEASYQKLRLCKTGGTPGHCPKANHAILAHR